MTDLIQIIAGDTGGPRLSATGGGRHEGHVVRHSFSQAFDHRNDDIVKTAPIRREIAVSRTVARVAARALKVCLFVNCVSHDLNDRHEEHREDAIATQERGIFLQGGSHV